MLFNRVLSAIEQVGLDPMLSNLHAIEDRRPSLALDLMEEFRTLVVDSFVVSMINRVEVKPVNFQYLGENYNPVGSLTTPFEISPHENSIHVCEHLGAP